MIESFIELSKSIKELSESIKFEVSHGFQLNEGKPFVENTAQKEFQQFGSDDFPSFEEGTIPGDIRLLEMDDLFSENWEKLTPEQRGGSLQELENRMAEIQTRTPCTMDFVPMEMGQSGAYIPLNNHIIINESFLLNGETRMEAIKTTIHEGRHAYQDFAIQHPETHLNTAEVQAWKENMNSYIQPDDDIFGYEDYYNQAVERDAYTYEQEKAKIFA